ncbi:cobalamin-binding protein [Alteromonas lipolytica]|uniref:Fe/B12 periplasmic-binding domain-containing protein n=1 Tax=Alteromonas lipolytica TaxID=1856405 RepID=A0A1E8FB58_9ALTE|nr:cobalamin-binding protein [Alteromonas lipolytica]OFI32733.1 hypothetical protein BFC17_06160 [Alteromonas lipolytica]GGF73629.1 cobalamin-binding protein [Alteromonas lipolytica]
MTKWKYLLLWAVCAVFSPTSVAVERIITLSPHLTEWIYSLGLEDKLVGVSAFSDYPAEASEKPVVADYQGVDFTALMALEPDLVLAWGGGNKPQDITRLKSLGIPVFISQPDTLDAIASEILEVARLAGADEQSQTLVHQYRTQLAKIQQQYQHKPVVKVFYYMWSQPLMTIGKAAWANKFLTTCGAQSIFNDSPIDYPQVSVKQVLLRQPQLLVAASDQSMQTLENFWAPHRPVIQAPLIQANVNALHRFTLRIADAIETLCHDIDSYRQQEQK